MIRSVGFVEKKSFACFDYALGSHRSRASEEEMYPERILAPYGGGCAKIS